MPTIFSSTMFFNFPDYLNQHTARDIIKQFIIGGPDLLEDPKTPQSMKMVKLSQGCTDNMRREFTINH